TDPQWGFARAQLTWASGLGGEVTATVTRPAGEAAKPARRLVVRLERDRIVPERDRLTWDGAIRARATVVDLAYTGKTLAPAQEGQVGTALLASGRSLLAERVRDLLVALQVLRDQQLADERTELAIYVHGFDGVLALFAALFLPENAGLVLDRT